MREPRISEAMSSFREAARHLWNTSFWPGAQWDDRDRFDRVCIELFDALVGTTFRIGARLPTACAPDAAPMQSVQVLPTPQTGVPILINRSKPSCGYWDDPVDQIRSADAQLQFVRFFFDQLGRRDFKFVEVAICDFASQPHVVGRRALIEFEYVTFEVADGRAGS
jgi:hypothetical protein